MARSAEKKKEPLISRRRSLIALVALIIYGVVVYAAGFSHLFSVDFTRADTASSTAKSASSTPAAPAYPPLNKAAYDAKLLYLAHVATTTTATTTASTTVPVAPKQTLWPVKGNPYPLPGALLPFNRIVAYYGNFYSKGMGVLGQYPEAQVLTMLKAAAAQWQAADPTTPVIPAIDYIAVTAQGSPGADGMYRLRMPDSQIEQAIDMANQVHGIVILDVQVGDSTVQTEVPLLQKYLMLPNVELALDPEFDMSPGVKPGTVIGTMGASEINFAANYLANLVTANNLPPKILIVHRFTLDMVQNYQNIKPLPQVQFVMDMDGWGYGAKKINTYNTVIYPEPVQFTGFKLFYKNDLLPPSTAMLTPTQILHLTPAPSFIQYQ